MKLSLAQLRCLYGAQKGNPANGCFTMAHYGGLQATLWSLRKRGLLTTDHKLTDAGREVLRTANAHALAEERRDDSQKRVVGPEVDHGNV